MSDKENDTLYLCQNCGLKRSKAEGGNVFAVCDECWDYYYSPRLPVHLSHQKQVDVDKFYGGDKK